MPQKTEPYRLAGEPAARVVLPDRPGLQGHGRGRHALQLLRSAAAQPAARRPPAWSPDRRLPSSERVHLDAEYQRYDWRGRARAGTTPTSTICSGPTKTSRKGYVVGSATQHADLRRAAAARPRRRAAMLAGNLDRLPEYQNVPVDVDRLYTLDATLTYTDVRNSLGSVDDETGRRVVVVGRGELRRRRAGRRDSTGRSIAGWRCRCGHSSVWLRSAAGFSPADRDEPFANFYLRRLRQQLRRPRRREALPRVLQLSRRRAQRDRRPQLRQVDWSSGTCRRGASSARARRASTRPGCGRRVFVGGLVTNLDAPDARTEVADVGGQLDFRLSALSALDLTLSVGGAAAFEDGRVRARSHDFAEGAALDARAGHRHLRRAPAGPPVPDRAAS